jgi:hypothetical protein
MAELSPAAQAVLKAVQATMPDYMMTDSTAGCFAAAAIRAAANQVVPANGSRKNNEIRAELLAIATELEAL